jgi:nucleotide-binding universal stress UspA family protein
MSKVLVGVHGYEPPGWARQAVHAVSALAPSQVRVLVVWDAPAPPLTSLAPGARRRYRAARAEWCRLAEAGTAPVVATLRAGLAPAPEVVSALASHGDPGWTIVEQAREWGAEVVVVGRDTRGRLTRALLGAAHQRVVDGAPCAVLVAPTELDGGTHPARVGPSGLASRPRTAVSGGQ